MAAFIIAYDLNKSGQNYTCVKAKLEAYPRHWHMQGSVWIIESSSGASAILDDLKSCLDSNDDLFVGKLSGQAAWHGLTNGSQWLKNLLQNA